MLVSTDNGAVDHHVFVVMVSSQMPENPLDQAAFAPATQPPVHVLSVPEPGRQITLGNACTVTIQHGFDKQTVIRSRPTDMTFATREKIFYPLPLTIAQTIPSHSHSPRSRNRKKTSQIKREYKLHNPPV
ncbi:hypothetical protein AD948_10465 [Acetobacter senegalensis]|uniref:Uncharacterized protein n=1 Tax=Acetobacter senegalensis TaxID=446692 RepID=A0A149TZY9_9PROT|nr:hypothetical protein AD948_10465 [Acetobacter senegalensis]